MKSSQDEECESQNSRTIPIQTKKVITKLARKSRFESRDLRAFLQNGEAVYDEVDGTKFSAKFHYQANRLEYNGQLYSCHAFAKKVRGIEGRPQGKITKH